MKDRIFINDNYGRKKLYVKVKDISHATAARDYVYLHIKGKAYIQHYRFNKLLKRLPHLKRISRFSAVSLSKIAQFEKGGKSTYILTMKDGDKVKVTPRHRHVIDSLNFL